MFTRVCKVQRNRVHSTIKYVCDLFETRNFKGFLRDDHQTLRHRRDGLY